MLVDSVPILDASSSFEHGNQSAALVHHTLRSRLASTGAMAGDASLASEFAAAYDEAAGVALSAVGDLVDAFSTCGRLTEACLANHGHAENRSLLSGRTVFTGTPCVAGYVSVLPCSLPSSLGGDLSGLPSWASWILDQVEGFVWPDADTARLRAAASAWRDASCQVGDLSAYCSAATRSFSLLRSPEVPVAVEVTSALADRCRTVADQCAVLARACETYADHVDEQRAAVLDLVHDLLRDAVVIEGIGIVLGVVTGGVTAAGATALNAARIAAAAPRLLRIISTLRTLASTCAAPLRLAASALRDVRLELSVFRRARITVASAYKAERVARVERLRSLLRDPRLLDPQELRGLSKGDVESLCKGWPVRDSSRGEGVVHVDPLRSGRQIRIMDGYPPGTRPDPLTEGPVRGDLARERSSQSRSRSSGTPSCERRDRRPPPRRDGGVLRRLRSLPALPSRLGSSTTACAQPRKSAPWRSGPTKSSLPPLDQVIWVPWPLELEKARPFEPGTRLDFDLAPDSATDIPLQVLVPDQADST